MPLFLFNIIGVYIICLTLWGSFNIMGLLCPLFRPILNKKVFVNFRKNICIFKILFVWVLILADYSEKNPINQKKSTKIKNINFRRFFLHI